MILHLMSAFPPLFEAFVMREIRELRADGWNIVIAPLRPLHRTPRAHGFEDLESCTIPPRWISIDLLAGFLFILLSRPRQCWRCVRIVSVSLGRPVRFVKMLYTLMSAMRIAWKMREANVELVRAHFLHTEALAARFVGLLLEVPYSVTVYTVFVELPEAVIRDIVSNAAFLVADTHQTQQFLKSFGIEPDRIHVVHNSVNTEEFPARSLEKAGGCPILLGIGRLDPKKGFDVLISACSILRERGVDFRCVIVGDGAERDRLLAMRARLKLEDLVEMIGKLSFAEVKPWYYRATIFAMPSVVTSEGQTDGLPTVVIEAMASGLPIVGSSVAGIPEAVQDGINGFLVPPNEPEQLANRLQLLLGRQDLRMRFGSESRRIAEMQFSLRNKALVLTQVIQTCVKFAFRSPTVRVNGEAIPWEPLTSVSVGQMARVLCKSLSEPARTLYRLRDMKPQTMANRSASEIAVIGLEPAPVPIVTVVVPCRNEEKHIARCLESILANDYPGDRIEILVVDGMSEDHTREIVADYVQRYPQLRLVNNPASLIPAAMNLGIKRARGEVVMKVDAHSTYPVDYVSNSVHFLKQYGADIVGGILKIVPGRETTVAQAIALALSNAFGSGNAYVKIGCKEPRWADSVSWGSFDKGVFEWVGLWNEELAGSSDMDFNVRLRNAGGRILLVPSIVTEYCADSDLKSLWRHNFADGVWATYVLKFGSRAWAWRHWIPMLFVASLAGSAVLSMFLPKGWWLFCSIAGVYILTNLAASAQIAVRERRLDCLPVLPIVFAARHISHGLGALYGLVLAALPGKRWKGRRSAKG